jgi:hypothetical protein
MSRGTGGAERGPVSQKEQEEARSQKDKGESQIKIEEKATAMFDHGEASGSGSSGSSRWSRAIKKALVWRTVRRIIPRLKAVLKHKSCQKDSLKRKSSRMKLTGPKRKTTSQFKSQAAVKK